MCIIVHHVIFPMQMAKLTILGHYTCWFMVYVVWAIPKNYHYVGLGLVFKRMTHAMFNTTLGPSIHWQTILPFVHLIDMVHTIT